MKKEETIRGLLRKCGRKAVLVDEATGKAAEARAVIQPLRYRNNAHTGGVYLPPGFADTENYLYLGPADPPVDDYQRNGFVKANREEYTIRRAQRVYFEDQCVYVWAILQKRRREE